MTKVKGIVTCNNQSVYTQDANHPSISLWFFLSIQYHCQEFCNQILNFHLLLMGFPMPHPTLTLSHLV